MPKVTEHALVMAVQAVQAQMKSFTDEMPIAELEPDDQELYLAYSRAAAELKSSYIEARQAAPQLPPYEELVP
jgi:hypothetical protein